MITHEVLWYLHLWVQSGDDRLDGGLGPLRDFRKETSTGPFDPTKQSRGWNILRIKQKPLQQSSSAASRGSLDDLKVNYFKINNLF